MSSKILLITSSLLFLAAGCSVRPPGQTHNIPNIPTATTQITGEGQPPNSVPAIDDLTLANRQFWYEKTKWPKECEDTFRNLQYSPDYSGLILYQLNPNTHLLQVNCFLGAYQGENIFVLIKQEETGITNEIVSFEIYESPDENPINLKPLSQNRMQILGVPDFNLKTKELTIFNKFRGPGDCGIVTTYDFTTPSIYPKMTRLAANLSCDGKPFTKIKRP